MTLSRRQVLIHSFKKKGIIKLLLAKIKKVKNTWR